MQPAVLWPPQHALMASHHPLASVGGAGVGDGSHIAFMLRLPPASVFPFELCRFRCGHVPEPYSPRLVKPLHECSRLFVSRAPKIIEQRSHQVAASLNFLLVGYGRGGTVDLSVGVDLHLGSNWDGERFRRRQNGIFGRSGDSSSFLQGALNTLLIRCGIPCSQKILDRLDDGRTNLRKPAQDLFADVRGHV
jgi:hypothetical protein